MHCIASRSVYSSPSGLCNIQSDLTAQGQPAVDRLRERKILRKRSLYHWKGGYADVERQNREVPIGRKIYPGESMKEQDFLVRN
jgi:hypothetical protein